MPTIPPMGPDVESLNNHNSEQNLDDDSDSQEEGDEEDEPDTSPNECIQNQNSGCYEESDSNPDYDSGDDFNDTELAKDKTTEQTEGKPIDDKAIQDLDQPADPADPDNPCCLPARFVGGLSLIPSVKVCGAPVVPPAGLVSPRRK